MRRSLLFVCLAAMSMSLAAQSPAASTTKPKQKLAPPQVAQLAAPQVLPVRKVVLYKNGVGYFEHAGPVTGNQRVAIDFTSPQLNDVLQSLTVLDEGGGRIGGVNYNSTTPLAEQLKSLSLGMGDDPTSTELFQALRGQRVEVTGGPGGTLVGHLMSIESRNEKAGKDDNSDGATVDKFYLTLVASSGAVRVIELTPALSVRPLDANLQGQLDRYLELLSSTHATGLRHLTLDALGQGQRQLRVSYISEVPVWKSTYRIVFPRTGASSEPGNSAILQGWAVTGTTCSCRWWPVRRRASSSRFRSRFIRAGRRFLLPPRSRPHRRRMKRGKMLFHATSNRSWRMKRHRRLQRHRQWPNPPESDVPPSALVLRGLKYRARAQALAVGWAQGLARAREVASTAPPTPSNPATSPPTPSTTSSNIRWRSRSPSTRMSRRWCPSCSRNYPPST